MGRFKEFILEEIVKPNGSIIFREGDIVDRLEQVRNIKNTQENYFQDLINDIKKIESECKGNANVDQLTSIRQKLERIVADLNVRYQQAVQITDQKLRDMVANNEKTVAETAYLFQKLQSLRK